MKKIPAILFYTALAWVIVSTFQIWGCQGTARTPSEWNFWLCAINFGRLFI